jgi:isoleucyl-tRNA synthetase
MSQSMVKRLVSKTDEMLSTPRSIKGSKKSTKAQLVSEEELPGITDAIKQGMSSTESQANPPMALLTTEIMLEKMILANSDNETDSKYLNALQLKILEANYEIAKINKEVETLFVRSLLNNTIDMKMVASIDALQADHKSLRLQAEELEKKAGERKVQVEAIKQSLNERQVNEMKNYHPEVEFFNKDKLIELATNLIESNKNEASLYRQGNNPALLGFFIGKMMKETLGAVGPNIVYDVMKHQLDYSI